MNRHRLLGITILLCVAGPLFGQRVAEELIERWRGLDRAARAKLTQRHEDLESLPEADRELILARHRVLLQTREEVVASMSPVERELLERLSATERRRKVDQLVKEHLRQEGAWLRDEFQQAGGLMEGTRVLFEELRSQVRARLQDRLDRLLESGRIDEAEASRLLALPEWRIGIELRKLNQELWLQKPPKFARQLGEGERQRLRRLPPRAFIHEVRRMRQGSSTPDPKQRLRDALTGRIPNPHPTPMELRHFLPDVDFESLASLPKPERRRQVIDLLRAKAEQVLRDRGEPTDVLDDIEIGPRSPTERILMRIIDPEYEPSAGGVRPGGPLRNRLPPNGGRPGSRFRKGI